jgi:hypothetical protein
MLTITVGYDPSLQSLKAAHNLLNNSVVNLSEVALPFLDEYLLKMIGILVAQR